MDRQEIYKLLLVLFHLFSSIFSGEGIFFRNAARFYFYSFLYYHKRLCFSSPDTGFRIKNVTSSPTCRGGGFPNLGRFGSRSIAPMC